LKSHSYLLKGKSTAGIACKREWGGAQKEQAKSKTNLGLKVKEKRSRSVYMSFADVNDLCGDIQSADVGALKRGEQCDAGGETAGILTGSHSRSGEEEARSHAGINRENRRLGRGKEGPGVEGGKEVTSQLLRGGRVKGGGRQY